MPASADEPLNGATHPRVLLVDDHRVVAEGIAELLRPCYTVLPLVADGASMVAAVLKERPDIVVADIAMPGLSGIEAFRQLLAKGVTVPTIFLTMHTQPAMIEEALRIGVHGYVVKSSAGEELLRAMTEVLKGGTFVSASLWAHLIGKSRPPMLTTRQQEVLRLLAKGHRSREIASELGLSVRTVETHRQSLMQVFEVRNSIELVREATRLGVIGLA